MACKYAYDRESFGEKFSDTLIVGHTTAHSSKLWVRVKNPGKYYLLLFKSFTTIDPEDIGEQELVAYLQ